jgi:hypothetical protein
VPEIARMLGDELAARTDREHLAGAAALDSSAVSQRVELTNADRVLFPDDGITKRDLFDYYGAVAPAIVPHLRDRPFTMEFTNWRVS